MYTREDFIKKAIEVSVAKHPGMAALIKAGDVRVMQPLEAMATMLEMYSAQLEVAQSEPFEKTRDSTVLADAAMRGIIPKSKPCVIKVRAKNQSSETIFIETGREVIDPKGRVFRADSPATIVAGGAGSFSATQVYSKEVTHTVVGSKPFYEIPIELADDDSSLCGLSLRDSNGSYEYRDRYTNTAAGERVYHIEADERQRVFARLGQDGVVGTQPLEGTELIITSHYSMGDVRIDAGSLLVFEVMRNPAESQMEMRLEELVAKGQNPPSIIDLRELSKYPSIYNNNAVFLGEFDFLIRRNFPDLKFLSVWNEGIEEDVRGMSLDNINALFVACLSSDETVLSDPSMESVEITELTGDQEQIVSQIRAADDSYRVRFYAPIRSPIGVKIKATIATSYDQQSVKEQIEDVMLREFGEQSRQSRHGRSMPLYQQIYQLLKREIQALSISGTDLEVDIEKASTDRRPELWRYVTPEALEVVIAAKNCTTPYWGGI